MNKDDIQAKKMHLAEKNVTLGRQRLYAAVLQAGLTTLNLVISVIILIHVLGGY